MKNEETINYFLTIGFIIMIFIILSSIIFISRIVFLNTNPSFDEHLINTKLLLEDISKVEEIVKNQNKTIRDSPKYIILEKHFNITDLSYSNINEKKSIITLIFDERISDIDNQIFYTLTKNLSELEKGEQIIYNQNEIGEIKNINEETYDILNIKTGSSQTINIKNIEGIVFLNLENE